MPETQPPPRASLDALPDAVAAFFRPLDSGGAVRSVRGGAVAVTGKALRLAIYLAGFSRLTRLLDDPDFGLMAMAAVVVAFVEIFRHLGLSEATVQRKRLTPELVNAAFWANASVALIAAVAIAASAPLLVAIYNEPRLYGIVPALGGTLLVASLGVQHEALLQRAMRFRALAVSDVVAQTAGLIVGVSAAEAGWGYWSLVAMHAAIAATHVAVVWVACPWRPGLPRRADGLRDMLHFGGFVTAHNVMNYVSRQVDDLLIGWRWRAGPLGQYANAYRLLLSPLVLVNVPATSVALPAMSRLHDTPDAFRAYYEKFMFALASVTLPLAVWMTLCARPLTLFLFGDKWGMAADVFVWLAPLIALQPISSTSGLVYKASGRARAYFYWSLGAAPAAALSFVIGLPWGPVGVARAYLVYNVVAFVPCMVLAMRGTSLRPGGLTRALVPLIVSAAAAGGVGWFAMAALPEGASRIVLLVVSFAAVGLTFAIAVLGVFRKGRFYRRIVSELAPGRVGGEEVGR